MADDFNFPPDLLQLERDFAAADAARTAAAGRSDEEFRAAHARAQELALKLSANEWLWSQPNRFEARMALREAARA